MKALRFALPLFLRVVFTPACWLQNYRFSAEWDRHLNQLLSEHRFENIGSHTATIGGFRVWIENHPYASFTPQGNMPSVRPRRTTLFRAYDRLMYDIFAAPREVDELGKLYTSTKENQ